MNRAQFIAIIQREQESLRRFLLALCRGNRDEADDIAQEALMKAYLAADKYEEKGKGAAWLYRIAYNVFVDWERSHRNIQPLDEAGERTDATFAADRDFQYQALYLALDQLSAREQTAILLFYIKGYTIREIAQIIEASEDAVKKLLVRGRDKLKTRLKDERG